MGLRLKFIDAFQGTNLLTLPYHIIYLKDLASLGCMRSLHLRNRGSITVNHVINVPPSSDQNELFNK